MDTVMNSEEENHLIDCIVHGEPEKFQVLVDSYQKRIYRGVFAILGNQQDAEDVTQEAFLTAFRKLDQFQHRSSFFTWLYRISYNLAMDVQRRASRTRKRFSNQSLDDGCVVTPDPRAEAPDRQAIVGETSELVRRALSSLDSERRNIIVLRDLEGLDYAEIAALLELPIGTVRSRLHRARMELREILLAMGVSESKTKPDQVELRPNMDAFNQEVM